MQLTGLSKVNLGHLKFSSAGNDKIHAPKASGESGSCGSCALKFELSFLSRTLPREKVAGKEREIPAHASHTSLTFTNNQSTLSLQNSSVLSSSQVMEVATQVCKKPLIFCIWPKQMAIRSNVSSKTEITKYNCSILKYTCWTGLFVSRRFPRNLSTENIRL